MGAVTGHGTGRAGQRCPRCGNRRFVDALLWMARSGGRWPDLPERFGDHQAVKRRYYRCIERGALDIFLQALTAEAGLEWPMIDSTIVRAQRHAADARIPKGGRMPRAWADLGAG
jgi:transposase